MAARDDRAAEPGCARTFEEELDRTMHRLGEGDYAFHGAFTLATGRLRDESPAQPSSKSAPEETPDVSAARSSLYASDSEPAFPSVAPWSASPDR